MTGSQEQISAQAKLRSPSTDWILYPPCPGTPDEAFDEQGEPRSHWRDFLSSLEGLGLPELTRRWEEAKNLIRENGVTYNVYGDPRGMERPWQLDPIPLLVPPNDAAILETGLAQRGRLLEAILQDLHGPRRCLTAGLLPPELVFASPSFLRSIYGVPPPGHRYLHLYAANVGRAADGSFWVFGNRTQAPSGAGYALENRIVLSRMLPDTFRNCQVHRLARFFGTLRDTLRTIAPHNRDNPRIVLLTPGPFNETYFEHAYLARYLGCTLVEGGNLTVRDNRVFLKVLGGLQPVDVIFRRLDDDFCDPLELRPDSTLGVPGLVQAVRSGNVSVANALGSGLLETQALLAFLPGLCRQLLGEELRLPSVATWWCGEEKAREHVLANLAGMVIKPALAGSRMEPIFGGELSRKQAAQLADRIRARPREFVGQARLTLSTTPVLTGGRLQPRHLLLRLYAVAHDDSYSVMPGGLTRVSAAADTMVVSMQRGGGSKDTWVLSAKPVSNFSLLPPPGQPVELSRGGRDLPSRVADNLFWLGRYAERTDGLARLLRVMLQRLIDTSGLAEVPELPALLRVVVRLGQSPGAVRNRRSRAPPRRRRSYWRRFTISGGPAAWPPTCIRWRAWPARCATASRPTCGACWGNSAVSVWCNGRTMLPTRRGAAHRATGRPRSAARWNSSTASSWRRRRSAAWPRRVSRAAKAGVFWTWAGGWSGPFISSRCYNKRCCASSPAKGRCWKRCFRSPTAR